MRSLIIVRIQITAVLLSMSLTCICGESTQALSHSAKASNSAANATPSSNSSASQGVEAPQIIVLGDSLSAEFGLERGTGWVSLLEAKLGKPARTFIINASISGETTSGGRSRLALLLSKYHPKILIIELGANDALRGISIEASKANLDWMVKQAVESNAKVLIVGNLVPANYGATLNKELSLMYAQVAAKNKVGLVPFMLRGVADAPNASTLFQADQFHPLAVAHPTILGNIWPELRKLL